MVVVVVEGCSAEDGGGWGGGIVRGEGEGWRKEAPTHISRYVIMLIVNFVHPFLAIGIFVDLTRFSAFIFADVMLKLLSGLVEIHR